MTLKNLLGNKFRGWLPQNPYTQTGACDGATRLNQSTKPYQNEDRPVMKRWMKASVVLCGVGYLVFYFLTPRFQQTDLGFSLWFAVMALLVFFDYLVIKDNLKKQRIAEDL